MPGQSAEHLRGRTWHEWLRSWFRRDSLGRWGERLAEDHLRRRGYRILARQYKTRLGEIDLIAEQGEWIVFVEVKTRVGLERGHPVEAVDPHKQRQLLRLAEAWLKRHPAPARRVRFDVVGILKRADGPPEIVHLEHAFRGD